MNWIGGRLQQSRRARGGLSAQQKAYFAKARAKLLNADCPRTPIDIPLFDTYRTNQNPRDDPFSGKHSGDEGTSEHSVRPRTRSAHRELQPILLNICSPNHTKGTCSGFEGSTKHTFTASDQVQAGQQNLKRRWPQEVQIPDTANKPKIGYDLAETAVKKRKSHLSHESSAFERKRQEMLKRTDWLSSTRVPPSQVHSFPQRSHKRLARRRKLNEDDLMRFGQQRHDRPRQAFSGFRPPRSRWYPGQDAISIRHGTQIHGSQMTQLQVPLHEGSSPVQPTLQQEKMLFDSSPEMILDERLQGFKLQRSLLSSYPYAVAHPNIPIDQQQRHLGPLPDCTGTIISKSPSELKRYNSQAAQEILTACDQQSTLSQRPIFHDSERGRDFREDFTPRQALVEDCGQALEEVSIILKQPLKLGERATMESQSVAEPGPVHEGNSNLQQTTTESADNKGSQSKPRKPAVIGDRDSDGQSLNEEDGARYKFVFGNMTFYKPTSGQGTCSKPSLAAPLATASSSSPLAPRASSPATTSLVKSAAQVLHSPPKASPGNISAKATKASSMEETIACEPAENGTVASSSTDVLARPPNNEADSSIESNQATIGTQLRGVNFEALKRSENSTRRMSLGKSKERVLFIKPTRYDGTSHDRKTSGKRAEKEGHRSTNNLLRMEAKRRNSQPAGTRDASGGRREMSTFERGWFRKANRQADEEDDIED